MFFSASSVCETGWTKFGMNCYKKSEDYKDWETARSTCISLGGDLLSILSQEEQDFIASLHTAGGYAYGGGNDRTDEGTFSWIDGSAWTYDYWRSGEPNDYGGNEDCMSIRVDGEWNDVPCQNSYLYICKK